jgi:hypothetical protein
MKRVIDGRTYNTDTATIVAKWNYEDEEGYDTEARLYRNRGGAFFIVHFWTVGVGEDAVDKIYFEAPVLRDQVDRLVEMRTNLEILDEAVLASPPEAEAEDEPSATIYYRLPSSLKAAIEAAAGAESLSVNAWLLRCTESCVARAKPKLTAVER